MTGPLAGLRVLDFTHFVAGPWCTMLMGDLGAEVIKVEPPHRGEISRSMGNVYAGDTSAIFLGFNRSKRSVTLDLKTSAGRDAVHRLVEQSDVVIQNFRPDVAARLELDAPTLMSHQPQLVYCAITAFGEDGPIASVPGNDPLIQGISGAMLASDPSRPIRLGVSLPDFAGGVLAAIAILAAYRRCREVRQGCAIALNLLDAQLFAQTDRVSAGDQHTQGTSVQCTDGAVWITNPAALNVDLADASALDVGTLLAAAGDNGVAAVPIAKLGDVLPGPHGRTLRLDGEDAVATTMVRTPLEFTPPLPEPDGHPPALGQHTEEVLREFGFDDDEIKALGAVAPVSSHLR